MKLIKELAHVTPGCIQQFLSSSLLERRPYADAKLLEGGHSILEKGFWIRRVGRRGFHVLVLSLSGSAKFTMKDGTEFILEEGNALLSSATGQAHLEETYGDKPWHCIWLNFDESSQWGIPPVADWQIFPLSVTKQLSGHFLSAMSEEYYKDQDSALAQELYAQLFLIALKRSLGWSEDQYSLMYRRQFSLLWHKVASDLTKPWSIEELCEQMNLSKAHLTRLCIELYQMSPGLRVRSIKMDQAKTLIENTGMPISVVCEMVGFPNPSTFSTAFKRFFGVSPKNLREMKRQEDARVPHIEP